jgi:lysylphosphatidylglycerol synthetase-like protein (DUF2156 family)
MAVGAAISIALFVHAVSSNTRTLVPFTAVLSLILITGCSLFLALAAVKFFEARRSAPRPAYIRTEGDYTAEYSWGDRIAASFFTILCAGLLCFFLVRGGHFRSIAISAALFCGMVYCTLEATGTRIRFTDQGLVARVFWIRHLAARYTDVRRVSLKPGVLKVEFSDGRSLRLYSALGKPGKVLAYLRARCPKSVGLD